MISWGLEESWAKLPCLKKLNIKWSFTRTIMCQTWFYDMSMSRLDKAVVTTLSKLIQRYWILQTNSTLKKNYRKMHALPTASCQSWTVKDVLSPQRSCVYRPSTHTGVDYFGHIMVRRGRNTVKRYGVICTCLAGCAVHLEMASFHLHERKSVLRLGQTMEPTLCWAGTETSFEGARTQQNP